SGGDGNIALKAVAGPEQDGMIGQSFTFNGCDSLFNDSILCSYSEDFLNDNFITTWYMNDQEIGQGFTINIETGEGTLFDAPKEYLLTFEIAYLDGGTPVLSSNDYTRLNLALLRQARSEEHTSEL